MFVGDVGMRDDTAGRVDDAHSSLKFRGDRGPVRQAQVKRE
jgi:hypothetical protein